jgi:hypothetical protein
MLPLPKDYQGRGASGSILVTNIGVKLPDVACAFVILHNLTIEDTLDSDTGEFEPKAEIADAATPIEATSSEIVWGFNNSYTNQLFAGQSSYMIPINNLKQISLRTQGNDKTVISYDYYY